MFLVSSSKRKYERQPRFHHSGLDTQELLSSLLLSLSLLFEAEVDGVEDAMTTVKKCQTRLSATLQLLPEFCPLCGRNQLNKTLSRFLLNFISMRLNAILSPTHVSISTF
jgi:hypothetical protein